MNRQTKQIISNEDKGGCLPAVKALATAKHRTCLQRVVITGSKSSENWQTIAKISSEKNVAQQVKSVGRENQGSTRVEQLDFSEKPP